MTESEIIAGCRRGEAAARRALYEVAGDRVYRLLLRMTHHHETALDLAHDTFIKAFGAIKSFNGASALTTWIHRIAVNEALQHLRRKSSLPLNGERAAELADRSDFRRQTEIHLDVEAALAKLDPTDRVILLLRYQEGLDYKAIAEAADVAIGTVASRLNRARTRLRAIMTESTEGGKETTLARHPTSYGILGPDRESDMTAVPSPGTA